MQRKYAHCCSVCFVLLVCGWFKPAGKKKTIFSSVGICWVTALSSAEAPAGYHNKVEKQKARGGKMGRGKRREQASLFPSHRVPRAFFFLFPRPPYDKKRRGLCGGAERGAMERIFRQIRDREQQKFWDLVHAYLDIFKTEIFFSVFEKIWVHQAYSNRFRSSIILVPTATRLNL